MIRCEVRAHALDLSKSWCLRTYKGLTPRTAMRWMYWQAGKLADQLDPHPWTAWAPRGALVLAALTAPDGPTELRAWSADLEAHSQIMTALRSGDPATVTVNDGTAYYTITAVPECFSIAPWAPPYPAASHPDTSREETP